MGLFDKKYCSVCGEKIGLFGNRKLEDGNLCKECAAKLSPWFSDRRGSTVDEITEQLDYREANREAVENFNTTRTLGASTKVFLDEDAGKFMVTSARNIKEANPDVMNFSQVTGCRIDIDENKSELFREDKEGNSVSYVPARYTYGYDFYIVINVNTPYFNEIRFKLNNSEIESPTQVRRGGAVGIPTPMMMNRVPLEYEEAENLGEEIKTALTEIHNTVRENIAAANAPKVAVTCPFCGATTLPDASGKCEYCGGALNI